MNTSPIIQLKRETVDAQGIFTAYAAVFGNIDSDNDIIEKGAFVKALADHEKNNTVPAMLFAHQLDEPVGKWLHLQEDDYGLLVTGKIIKETRRSAEALALLKADALGFSIGFMVAPGGYSISSNIRHIKQIARLAEISLVSMPSNALARLAKRPETRKEFEHQLRKALGLSAREAKKVSAGGYGGLVRNGEDSKLDLVLNEIQALRNQIERGNQ